MNDGALSNSSLHNTKVLNKYGDLTRMEMRDWIYNQYRAGQFKITVNGEPGAIISSDNSRRRSIKRRRGRTQY
jgi:hypothetical protein